MSVAWVILGRMDDRERLLATGVYGDLPPGVGPLVELSSDLIVRAFTAYAAGDLAACDGLVIEGREACGEVFTALVEHVLSPELPFRVTDPAWDGFLAWLAAKVLAPPGPAPAADPPPPAEPVSLAEELRAMGLM